MNITDFLIFFAIQYLIFVVLSGLLFLCDLQVFINDNRKSLKSLYPDENEEEINKKIYRELKGAFNYNYPTNLYTHFITTFVPVVNIFTTGLMFFWCLSRVIEIEFVANIIDKISQAFENFYFWIINKTIKINIKE